MLLIQTNHAQSSSTVGAVGEPLILAHISNNRVQTFHNLASAQRVSQKEFLKTSSP
jgi:hypothetical protein